MGNIKLSKMKPFVLVAAVAVIIGATAAEKGIGTFCNLCPVGLLQITAASRAIPVDMIFGVVIGLGAIFALGRFFCSWLCPSALVKSAGLKKAKVKPYKLTPVLLKYLPYAVLASAVIISFIVKFPVFCLICPVGLFFGFIFAIFKLFHVYEPGWNLIIFPLIIAAELLLFKKWCSRICPMAAVFTLVRKIPGPKFRLKVNNSACLLSKMKKCSACSSNCPEGLEITEANAEFTERCTSCMECKDVCPAESIHL